MIINLISQRRDDELEVIKDGDILTLNGEVYDFSPIQEGDILPQRAINSEWIFSAVTRVDGELILTLRIPHGPQPTEAEAFPVPLVDVPDGRVKLPTDRQED